MSEHVETVIVGGGQAGLAASYHLAQAGREHVVLEQAAQPGEAWRHHRWESFTFVTPNWMARLPGAPYAGDAPDGYLTRPEILAQFEQYEARFKLPVRHGETVTAVERRGDGGYQVTTRDSAYRADHVILATGAFQRVRRSPSSAALSDNLLQIDSDGYWSPAALPPGAVLVIGSAQSGCQIAEELYRSGRKVYLSVGHAARVPRRYRGHDITWWLNRTGFFDQTPDQLPSPEAKQAANPTLSGKDGGHTLNLHVFARDGVTLLGRFREGHGQVARFADDLADSLALIDRQEAEALQRIDAFIAHSVAVAAPSESVPQWRDGYEAETFSELDLRAAGITTIIWATGYTADYSLVKVPIFQADGYPQQARGVTPVPGLYFLGLNWLYRRKSPLLLGVGDDAAYVAGKITGRPPILAD